MNKDLLRLAAVLVIALSASACSTMSDVGDEMGSAASDVGDAVGSAFSALDPSGWFADNEPAVVNADDSQVETPDLAALPPRPQPVATPESQAQVAESLSADRAQAGYSAETLRGGTEAAAPPPPAGPQVASLPAPAPAPQAAPIASVPAASAPAPAPAAARPQVSAATGGLPAVPAGSGPAATPGRPVAVNTTQPTDAQLGFKPSTAPALDPSISQWVAPPIVSRYQQTAAMAGIKTSPVVSPVAAAGASLNSPRGGEGGPDAMSGAVVANLDAVNNSTASAYANLGVAPPTAVVMFPGDGVLLSAEARAQVRAVAQQFKARGGQGYIRVVGHASSRTANMPVEQHLRVIFEKSQSRASAVAQELIRQGVPAANVLIEAVGDSQPIYYESMPQGENGNRRAEIFLQG